MQSFFEELFVYNHYYNLKLADSFLAHQRTVSGESIKIFSHVLNAHAIWNDRIMNKTPGVSSWDIHNPAGFTAMVNLNQENTTLILRQYPLDNIVVYANGKEQRTVSKVLFHIINHSTYHRGQLATDFRKNGVEPIATDFIHFKGR